MAQKAADSTAQLLSLFKRPFQPSFIPVDDIAVAVNSPVLVSGEIIDVYLVLPIFLA